MKPSLTHLALHVRDLDACIDFYASYAQMQIARDRTNNGYRVVWLAEDGREKDFILVFLPGGPGRNQTERDLSHLGFALESRAKVDAIADRAKVEGILAWEPVEEPYPVGYYCGVTDPDGNIVEFSYGQPLGPGTA
jgi:catechol 2,3-dioxygenase-like lactoylglutathione lyase family enzyme